MSRQAFEPAELVVELRPGRRIAVGQVEAADQHAVHRCLDVAAVRVVGVARQAAAGLDRLGASREDGHAVPAFLAVPNCTVAGLADRGFREPLARGLEFLQADHVRQGVGQPAQQHWQAPVDAVDVEGRYPHARPPAPRDTLGASMAATQGGSSAGCDQFRCIATSIRTSHCHSSACRLGRRFASSQGAAGSV